MIGKQPFLVLLAIFIFFMVTWVAVGPVYAQQPDNAGGSQAATPQPTTAPSASPAESDNPPPTRETAETAPSPSPTDGGSPSPTPEPAATPLPEMTGLGWTQEGDSSPPASDVSILALTPVNCAVMSSPVVGFEISRGQDSNDVADFTNDLLANGFSVGAVDISGGVNPPACVDVLIVYGLSQNRSLASPYSAAEGALLQTWAAGGHGLMLFGDWGPFRAGTDALFQTYGYSQQGSNPVTDLTDSEPSPPAPPPANAWVIYQTDNFASHPILNGVASLEFLASSWLPATSNAIVTTDADATPPNAPVMAAFVDGAGCVAVSTDSNWIGVAGGGYFKQDNATVARQMVTWLNGCGSLALTKLAAPSPVQAGGLLTYTLTAVNNSAQVLTNVVITDTVPVSTSFVSASPPFIGPDANGVVTWSLGALDPNASASRTLVVQVNSLAPAGSIITNTAWITSNQGLTDTATAFTPVSIQIVDPLVTKAVNTSQAQVGDVITFTLTVQQAAQSSSNATNVQIVDALPDEVDLLSAEVNAGFTTIAGRVVTWTIPILTPTDIRLMTIRAVVNAAGAPPLLIRNQASLSFDQGANRLSNLVELAVPAQAPTATPIPIPTPTSPPHRDKDKDNDNDDPSPPAATPVAAVQPVAPTVVLPVAFLPDTG
ncbi:MAG: hypothetical protein AB1801_25785, partial [Chloroflexota bacterium]